MVKKIVLALGLFVLANFMYSARGCFMDRGVKAIPTINQTPKQVITIVPKFERLPPGIDINKYQHHIIARYESMVKECSVIRAPAGWVDTPVYETAVEGDIATGFRVYQDLITEDKCDWKLTVVLFTITDKNKNILLQAAVNLTEEKRTVFCKFGGPLHGECLGFAGGRLPFENQDNTDDTTITFLINKQKMD